MQYYLILVYSAISVTRIHPAFIQEEFGLLSCLSRNQMVSESIQEHGITQLPGRDSKIDSVSSSSSFSYETHDQVPRPFVRQNDLRSKPHNLST